MGLTDDLAALSGKHYVPGPRCTMCALLDALPPHEADAVRAALADPRVLGSKLAHALEANGHHMKPLTVQRHRRGDCAGGTR